MSRRVANQEQVFRAVVVYKKTEKNPEFIPDKYLGNGQWEHGNKLPPLLYLDEPDEGRKVVYGPYSRIGDASAALKRNGHRRGALRESVHHIRIEFSDLDWKHIAENEVKDE